jgi:hypothetical protein
MWRSVLSVLVYLTGSFVLLLLLLNILVLVDPGIPDGLSPFVKTAIQVFGYTVLVLAVILPFTVYPFPLISRLWERERDVRFFLLVKSTPEAYLRSLIGLLHSTFTLMVVGLPLLASTVLCAGIVLTGNMMSVEFALIAGATTVLYYLLGKQVFTRFLSPLVGVLIGQGCLHALSLTFEIVRTRAVRLMLVLATIGCLFAGLSYITPLSGADLLVLIDGSVLTDSSRMQWNLLLQLLPFVVCGVVSMLVLSREISRSIADCHLSRLEWMLDANVSQLSIKKLALSGYFG